MQKLNPTPNHQLSLPIPSDDAQLVSRQLETLIHAEIAACHGVIPFSRYMEMALYTPRLGYYSGGSVKLGADGDFTTAPEMSSLFGATLAQVAQQLFTQSAPEIMEFGAGSGKLAFDILSECQQSQIPLRRYFIVELSGELRARQEERLKDFPQVVWLSKMPTAFSGIVIGNEVLDAMPVELVCKSEQGWTRLGVSSEMSSTASISGFKLVSIDEATDQHVALLTQIPDSAALPNGYLTEVHPIEIGFMRSIAAMLMAGHAESGQGGVAIWLDYGFPAHEYYLPQRDQGTLMCHYRHHAHPDPFYLPGLQDITAHVDFTAVAIAGVEAGLDLLSYTSQAGFLLGGGITEVLARIPAEDSRRYLPASNAVQKLLSPAEMGELFKVLILGTGVALPEALLQHDRSHRL
nr:SAM-dependent methyltransferase [uncultured Undibacterium sp.]